MKKWIPFSLLLFLLGTVGGCRIFSENIESYETRQEVIQYQEGDDQILGERDTVFLETDLIEADTINNEVEANGLSRYQLKACPSEDIQCEERRGNPPCFCGADDALGVHCIADEENFYHITCPYPEEWIVKNREFQLVVSQIDENGTLSFTYDRSIPLSASTLGLIEGEVDLDRQAGGHVRDDRGANANPNEGHEIRNGGGGCMNMVGSSPIHAIPFLYLLGVLGLLLGIRKRRQ